MKLGLTKEKIEEIKFLAQLQHKFLKENPELTPIQALEMAKNQIKGE
jgi:hypothetical protein